MQSKANRVSQYNSVTDTFWTFWIGIYRSHPIVFRIRTSSKSQTPQTQNPLLFFFFFFLNSVKRGDQINLGPHVVPTFIFILFCLKFRKNLKNCLTHHPHFSHVLTTCRDGVKMTWIVGGGAIVVSGGNELVLTRGNKYKDVGVVGTRKMVGENWRKSLQILVLSRRFYPLRRVWIQNKVPLFHGITPMPPLLVFIGSRPSFLFSFSSSTK